MRLNNDVITVSFVRTMLPFRTLTIQLTALTTYSVFSNRPASLTLTAKDKEVKLSSNTNSTRHLRMNFTAETDMSGRRTEKITLQGVRRKYRFLSSSTK